MLNPATHLNPLQLSLRKVATNICQIPPIRNIIRVLLYPPTAYSPPLSSVLSATVWPVDTTAMEQLFAIHAGRKCYMHPQLLYLASTKQFLMNSWFIQVYSSMKGFLEAKPFFNPSLIKIRVLFDYRQPCLPLLPYLSQNFELLNLLLKSVEQFQWQQIFAQVVKGKSYIHKSSSNVNFDLVLIRMSNITRHRYELSFLPRCLVKGLDHSCGSYFRTTTKKETGI